MRYLRQIVDDEEYWLVWIHWDRENVMPYSRNVKNCVTIYVIRTFSTGRTILWKKEFWFYPSKRYVLSAWNVLLMLRKWNDGVLLLFHNAQFVWKFFFLFHQYKSYINCMESGLLLKICMGFLLLLIQCIERFWNLYTWILCLWKSGIMNSC